MRNAIRTLRTPRGSLRLSIISPSVGLRSTGGLRSLRPRVTPKSLSCAISAETSSALSARYDSSRYDSTLSTSCSLNAIQYSNARLLSAPSVSGSPTEAAVGVAAAAGSAEGGAAAAPTFMKVILPFCATSSIGSEASGNMPVSRSALTSYVWSAKKLLPSIRAPE